MPQGRSRVEVYVKNTGQRELTLGDILGGRRIIEITTRGRKIEALGVGMSGKLILNGMPILTIGPPYDDLFKE